MINNTSVHSRVNGSRCPKSVLLLTDLRSIEYVSYSLWSIIETEFNKVVIAVDLPEAGGPTKIIPLLIFWFDIIQLPY
jgi:hypothetical protein